MLLTFGDVIEMLMEREHDEYIVSRTCMFCMFGAHLDKKFRIDRLRSTHPSQYKYLMDRLGMREVLEWYPVRLK